MLVMSWLVMSNACIKLGVGQYAYYTVSLTH